MKVSFRSSAMLTAVLVLGLFASCAHAEVAGYSYDIIESGGGARLIGMGKAFVAAADDPNALFVNPAGLSYVKNPEVMGMYYSRLIDTVAYLTGGGVMPTEYGVLGIGYVSAGVGGIIDTTDPDNLDKFSYADTLVIISYGTPLSRFFVIDDERFKDKIDMGVSAKLFSGGFSGSQNSGHFAINMDLGFNYRIREWVTLGIVKHNLLPPYLGGSKSWQTGSEENLSSPIKVGAAFKVNDGRTLLNADMIMPSISGYPLLFNLGGEHLLDSMFFVRAGLNQMVDSAQSGGTFWGYSLGLGIHVSEFKLDYAYKPYYDIAENTVHYISMSYVFGQAKKEEPKRVQAPPPPAPAPKPAPEQPKITLKKFNDVPDGYWAKDAIEYLATLGILGGYPDDTFRPEAPLTRAEFSAVLVRASQGEPPAAADAPYPDVPARVWFSRYVKAASDSKLVGGYPDGRFMPDEKVTRSVGIVLLSRFAKLPLSDKTEVSPFPDFSVSHWAAPNVLAAYKAGLLEYLKGRSLQPNRPMTRAEVAEILSRTEWGESKIRELKGSLI